MSICYRKGPLPMTIADMSKLVPSSGTIEDTSLNLAALAMLFWLAKTVNVQYAISYNMLSAPGSEYAGVSVTGSVIGSNNFNIAALQLPQRRVIGGSAYPIVFGNPFPYAHAVDSGIATFPSGPPIFPPSPQPYSENVAMLNVYIEWLTPVGGPTLSFSTGVGTNNAGTYSSYLRGASASVGPLGYVVQAPYAFALTTDPGPMSSPNLSTGATIQVTSPFGGTASIPLYAANVSEDISPTYGGSLSVSGSMTYEIDSLWTP